MPWGLAPGFFAYHQSCPDVCSRGPEGTTQWVWWLSCTEQPVQGLADGVAVLLPRLLRPLPADGIPTSSVAPARSPLTLISAREGTFIGEVLARLIADDGRWDRCSWLREPPEQPFATEHAVVDALALRHQIDRSREYRRIDRAFHACQAGSVLVIELVGRCSGGLGRMIAGLRDYAEQSGTAIVVSVSGPVPGPLLRASGRAVPIDTAAIARAEAGAAGLDALVIARVQKLLRGRDAVLHDLAAAHHPSSDAIRLAAGSHTGRAFLRKVTGLLLDEHSGDEREAIEMAVRTGYWHPQFSAGSIETAALRPWLVPLEHDWGWVRPVWRRPLIDQLTNPRISRRAAVPDSPLPVMDEVWDPVVEIRLLGPLEIRVDGQLADGLTGHLGTSVLRYLLMRPDLSCFRDQLLETFWPDADPERARNRLQVALSSFRRTIRQFTDVEIVEYVDGAYRLNRNLDLNIDVREFERLAAMGARAAKMGDTESALKADASAVQVYRGDLCPDLPYDEWAVFPRERLRMMYGDVLDRLARHQWGVTDHDGCITTAQLMLEQDPCREDAHRLLMRCYAEQGRTHQALRQFDACRRVLKATLGANPSRDTVAAYLDIRDQGG